MASRVTETDADPIVRVMVLLQKLRAEGICLHVRDLEPLLPRNGIRIGSRDHFILLMADFELAADEGQPIPLRKLLADYPRWAKRIRNHLRFLSRVASLVRNRTL